MLIRLGFVRAPAAYLRHTEGEAGDKASQGPDDRIQAMKDAEAHYQRDISLALHPVRKVVLSDLPGASRAETYLVAALRTLRQLQSRQMKSNPSPYNIQGGRRRNRVNPLAPAP